GPAYGRHVSVRAVAGALRAPAERSSPAFATRSPSFALLELWSGPCPSSTPRRVLRHHRWWRLLELHRRRPCFREAEASSAPLSPALASGGRSRLSGGIWRCLCEAFFLVVVINGSGGDLACAIDLSDDRISGLKAVAVTMIWSCRARVCTGGSIDGCFTGGFSALRGSRCGSRRWLTGAVVTLSLVDSK
ncbi:hypothetical protein HID58_027331, partial [Brassica napus]